MSNSAKETKKPSKFDFRWVILGISVIIVVIVAIVINNNRINNGSNKIIGTIDVDNGDQKINWERYQTVDNTLENSLTISKSGTYHLTGSLENGFIAVDAGVSEVRLILDNVSIHNGSGPAIYCSAAEDLVIELIGENTLSDDTTYATSYDEDVTGVIYSKADLAFQGDGTLNLTANYQDGIVGKDDVKFNSGTYNITSIDDGIRGKDSVYIVAGAFSITAGADAIKSTNEIDTGKGFIMIENGNLSINAVAKGIKSPKSILFYGGNFDITSKDDAIHSNSYVGFIGGQFTINSGDDGIHADKELIIDSGQIDIVKSYEGIEAQAVTINNGNISIIASDDGINAGGGADSSATNRQGAGAFDADTNCIIAINGGNVYVNAAGDGIDSNGYLNFSGGAVTVDGPTNNGNGSLDSGAGITMNGGTVIAVGSSGMAETLGSSSNIYNISAYFSNANPAHTNIKIKDANNNTVLEHTSAKTFTHLVAGNEKLTLGNTYTIYLNDEKYQDFTIINQTTTVGNPNTNQNMMPGGGKMQH